MPSHDLVPVYTLNNAVQAEMIKNMLAEEGIPCMLDGLQAGELGLNVFEIHVMVPEDQKDQAAQLIADHEPGKFTHSETESDADGDDPGVESPAV